MASTVVTTTYAGLPKPPTVTTYNRVSTDPTIVTLKRDAGAGGYEFTGGFVDRTSGSTGNLISDNFQYTGDLAASGTWKRFGFSAAQQAVNDVEYWGETTPGFD